MESILKTAFIVLGLFWSSLALSATASVSGKVTEIVYYGDGGMILVSGLNSVVEGSTDSCNGGTRTGFVVAGNNPQKNEILSILLMAKAAQTKITVYNLDIAANCWAPNFTSVSRIRLE